MLNWTSLLFLLLCFCWTKFLSAYLHHCRAMGCRTESVSGPGTFPNIPSVLAPESFPVFFFVALIVIAPFCYWTW